MNDNLEALHQGAGDPAEGAGLDSMGSDDRRPDAGRAGDRPAIPPNAGKDRAGSRTGYEHVSTEHLADLEEQADTLMRKVQSERIKINREIRRRKRHG